jgi:hypothetical protein
MSLSRRARRSRRRFMESRGQDDTLTKLDSGNVIHAGSSSFAPSDLRTIRCRAPPCSVSPTTSTD